MSKSKHGKAKEKIKESKAPAKLAGRTKLTAKVPLLCGVCAEAAEHALYYPPKGGPKDALLCRKCRTVTLRSNGEIVALP